MLRYISSIFFIILLSSCNGCKEEPDYDSSLPVPRTVAAPRQISYKILNVYPHDTASFTQGLEFFQGKLLEGTGELRQSSLRLADIKTGIAERSHTLSDPSIFGEGVTVLNNKLYQLTWQNNKIFEYNPDNFNTPIKTYPWPHEGWGVTNNGRELIISDGTPTLYFVTPDEASSTIKINKTLTVRDNTGPVKNLNELELIDGSIYANKWFSNQILVIDTTNGDVTGVLDLKGILKQYDPGAILTEDAVLNGIAYDSATKKIYVTGKKWPKLFEIELN